MTAACNTSDSKEFKYRPRDPSGTLLYRTIQENLETFLARLQSDPNSPGLPEYVEREFRDFLRCGILAHGFLRYRCKECEKELLVGFSCKRRGFCPSCLARRMTETAAYLSDHVIPHENVRQWVVTHRLPSKFANWDLDNKWKILQVN